MIRTLPVLSGLALMLALGSPAVGQTAHLPLCPPEAIAAARDGSYTGPACRFTAEGAARPAMSHQAQARQPVSQSGSAHMHASERLVSSGHHQTHRQSARRDVVQLSDGFFSGSLAGGVERPGPVFIYRNQIVIYGNGHSELAPVTGVYPHAAYVMDRAPVARAYPPAPYRARRVGSYD